MKLRKFPLRACLRGYQSCLYLLTNKTFRTMSFIINVYVAHITWSYVNIDLVFELFMICVCYACYDLLLIMSNEKTLIVTAIVN